MKTSYLWYAFLFVLGGIAVLAAQHMLFVKAVAQQPPAATPAPPVSRVQFDGKVIVEQRADGTVVHRTPDGKVIQTFTGKVAQYGSADGLAFQLPVTVSSEATKLMQEEVAAAQETQKLAAEYRSAESDGDKEKIKTQLREKLTAIFDLQQKRRASEIEQIQTRLKKLEETMSKRDAAKKEIVERRVEVLTGGIDELGWEDTLRYGPNSATFQRVPNVVPYPAQGTGSPQILPDAVGPPGAGAGAFPSPLPVLPVPSSIVPTVPGLPGVAPAPAAAGEPAALPPSTTPAPTTPRR